MNPGEEDRVPLVREIWRIDPTPALDALTADPHYCIIFAESPDPTSKKFWVVVITTKSIEQDDPDRVRIAPTPNHKLKEGSYALPRWRFLAKRHTLRSCIGEARKVELFEIRKAIQTRIEAGEREVVQPESRLP